MKTLPWFVFAGIAAVPLCWMASTPAPAPAASEAPPPLVALRVAEASSNASPASAAACAIDQRLETAWTPAATDTTPSLTVVPVRCTDLAAVGLKLAPTGVRVDVETERRGTWELVATNLAPQAGRLDVLPIPLVEADHVRLRFHGALPGQLAVSEVELFGLPCPYHGGTTP